MLLLMEKRMILGIGFLLGLILFLIIAVGVRADNKSTYHLTVSGTVYGDGRIEDLRIETYARGEPSLKNPGEESKIGEFEVRVLSGSGKVLAENVVFVDRILLDMDIFKPTGNPFIDAGKGDIVPKHFELTFRLKEKAASIEFYLHGKRLRTEKVTYPPVLL